MKRGIVYIKPVYIGLPHYREVYGSVCSADVERVPEVIVGSQHISMTFGHWQNVLENVGVLLGMQVQHL